MPGKHALLECTVCKKYPIRSNNMKQHMRKHANIVSDSNIKFRLDEKIDKYAMNRNNGYFTDDDHEEKTVENDMDGDGDSDDNTVDNNKAYTTTDDSESEEEKNMDVDGIGKYIVNENKEFNKNHSKLLPKDIRALIVGKSGAGKSVFLTYLLLEPDMLDYDNLIVCGPSLHQPLYNIMNKGFSINLSKDEIRYMFEIHDEIKRRFGDVNNFLKYCIDKYPGNHNCRNHEIDHNLYHHQHNDRCKYGSNFSYLGERVQ